MSGIGRVPPSEALVAIRETLSDGAWQDGIRVLRAGERAVPPGPASRAGLAANRTGTPEEQLASGRRTVARDAFRNAIGRGTLEVDVELPLTKEHWSGQTPWRVRDPWVGYRSVSDVADELGVTASTLYTWVNRGFVPHSLTPKGDTRFSPSDFAIVRKVREVWPGPGKVHWPVDPKSLWREAAAVTGPSCPHCGEPLTIVVGKP